MNPFIPFRSFALANAGGGATAWSPLALFAAGEEGGWYDPSDLSTMFQDSAGTTPVTAVEQPVGLMLDKSQGLVLGSNLISNGTFDSDSGWGLSTGETIVDGVLRLTAVSAGRNIQPLPNFSAVVGRLYKVSLTIKNYVSGSIRINFGGINTPTYSANGVYTSYVRAVTTGVFQLLVPAGPATLDIDDISVQQLSGNHALQATAASRPVLRQTAGGLYYLEFDGVDDSLATAAIDFSATHLISAFAGVVRNAEKTGGIFKLGTAATPFYNDPGSCVLHAEWEPDADYYLGIGGGTVGGFLNKRFGPYPATNKNVLYASWDASQTTGAAACGLNVDAVEASVFSSTQFSYTTTNFANKEITICKNETAYFNGKLYSLIIRGTSSSPQEITDAEAYVAGKTGVTLS